MELSLDAIGSARAVLIAGPTASGKSAAALALAEEAARRGRAAWIVNADAMQVYDGAPHPDRAPERSRRGARSAPPLRPCVARDALLGRRLACRRGAGACARRRPPARSSIAVGGTGLYFKALTEGLAAIPDIPADVRARLAERLDAEGVARAARRLAEARSGRPPRRSGRAIRSACCARSRFSRRPADRSANGRRRRSGAAVSLDGDGGVRPRA